jgi:hypothetical protein
MHGVTWTLPRVTRVTSNSHSSHPSHLGGCHLADEYVPFPSHSFLFSNPFRPDCLDSHVGLQVGRSQLEIV